MCTYTYLSVSTVASGNSASRNSGISCYSGDVQLTDCLFKHVYISLVIVESLVIVDILRLMDESTITRGDCIYSE